MSRACKRPASSAGSSRELRHRRNTDAFPISDVRSPPQLNPDPLPRALPAN